MVAEMIGSEAWRPNGTYFGGPNPYGTWNPSTNIGVTGAGVVGTNRMIGARLASYSVGGYPVGGYPGTFGNVGMIGTGLANINPANAFAENAGMKKLIRELNDAITNNKTKAITKTWEKLMAQYRKTAEYKEITATGDEASEQAAIGRLQEIYQAQTGKDIIEQLNENVSGNFMSGIKNAFSLGIAQDKSSDELKEIMFKSEDNTGGSTFLRGTGAVVGGTSAGAAIGTCICPGVGTAIGACVGALYGLIVKLWS